MTLLLLYIFGQTFRNERTQSEKSKVPIGTMMVRLQ